MLDEKKQPKIIEVKSCINLHILVYTKECEPTDNYTFDIFNNREIKLAHQNILNIENLRSIQDSRRPLSDARLIKRIFIFIFVFIYHYYS